jgi:putative heme-binding domain-containing protein
MHAKLFAALLSIAGAAIAQQPGSAQQGAAIFEGKGGCTSCHRVKDKGSRLGVNLTDIGNQRQPAELEKALLEPPAEVQPKNQLYRVVTTEGTTHTGKILNQDTSSIQMLDSTEHLRSFPRSSLKENGFAPTPPMPSYKGKLTPQELKDLVAYLSQLKGVAVQ